MEKEQRNNSKVLKSQALKIRKGKRTRGEAIRKYKVFKKNNNIFVIYESFRYSVLTVNL